MKKRMKKVRSKKYKLLTNPRELKFFTALGIILVIFLTISIVLGSRVQRGNISNPTQVVKKTEFDNLNLTASAVYVYDSRTGDVLYAKNASKRMPLASLTKVMTALVALDTAPSNSSIQITTESLSPEGDSGLLVGETWHLKDLLDFSLTSSSNDGMHAVALALGALHKANPTENEAQSDFVLSMNKKAAAIGMKNTYYINETGLDESTHKGGAYGTAEDMARLFDYILRNQPELLEATASSRIRVLSLDNYSHSAVNTDEIVDDIPGIIASKTGFTDIAGGNLVIAFDPELGRPIIISVLGSTQSGRFDDMKKLVDASIRTIQKDKLETE
jgi:serine-type D-Ala-D-Ala carboxypeptidase (penicillin-binding protein 5/6)